MKNTDKAISLIVLGLLAPVVLMLLFWWGSIPLADDVQPLLPVLAVAGLALGVVLDCTVLRRFLFRLFAMPVPALAAVEVFYSVMVYGFLMGVPVGNCLVGAAGCYIAARSGILQKAAKKESAQKAKQINRFSLGILLALCVCSAVLALNEDNIGAQVKSMLGLPFDVTTGMVWVIIVVGGCLLLLVQYTASKFVIKRVIEGASGSKC